MNEETSQDLGVSNIEDGYAEDDLLNGLTDGGADQTAEPEETTDEENVADGGADQTAESDEAEPEAEPAPAEQTQEEPARMLQMRYNGRTTDLSAEAVESIGKALGMDAGATIALIQKGMNYDHKAERELRILQNLASLSGSDYNTFLSNAEREHDELLIRNEMQRVASELPEGTPEEALRRIAESNLADKRARDRITAARNQAAAESGARNQRVEPFRELLREFPELNADNLPKEVWDAINKGARPLSAYYAYQRDQARREADEAKKALETERKNKSNRRQSTGAMSSTGAANDDPFLRGLMGLD